MRHAELAAPGDGQKRAAPERHGVELNRCAVAPGSRSVVLISRLVSTDDVALY